MKQQKHQRKKVKISVIIPTYNRKNLVAEAIALLKQQTLSQIEFIIIDDGSTDDSYNELLKHTKKDNRFIIKKLKTNSGPSVARNVALNLAQGDYIGFFDIDDKIPADYYDKLYAVAAKTNADIVFTNYNETQHRTGISCHFDMLRNGALWDKIFNRTLIETNNIRFLEGRYTADNLFVINAFLHADKIKCIQEPRYLYMMRSDSIGQDEQKTTKRKEDILAIANEAARLAAQLSAPKRVALRAFINRSLNCYMQDIEWEKCFNKVLDDISPAHEAPIRLPKRARFFARLKNIVLYKTGFINRQLYTLNRQEWLVQESAFFDTEWYMQKYKADFKAITPARHYLLYGWREQNLPSELFNGNKYLQDNTDVAAVDMCPLVHYLLFGQNEQRAYEDMFGIKQVNQSTKQKILSEKKSIRKKINHILTYPIRLKEECDRLAAEIKELEKNLK